MCEESRVNYIKCRESADLKCTAATTQGRFMGTIGWAGSGGRWGGVWGTHATMWPGHIIGGPGFQGEWQALLKPSIFGNHLRKSNAKRRLTTITIEPLVVCICMCDTMTSAPGQCGYCLPAQGTQGRLSQQRSPHFLSASLAAHPHPPTVRDFFTWKFLIILSLAS